MSVGVKFCLRTRGRIEVLRWVGDDMSVRVMSVRVMSVGVKLCRRI